MKTLSMLSKFYEYMMQLVIGLLIFLVISSCSTQPILTTTSHNLRMTMQDASQLRSQAEQRVKLIKQAYHQNRFGTDEYQIAQSLYGTAKDSMDLWINQVQGSLKAGKSVHNSDEYSLLAENASNQSRKFNDYVDELLHMVARGVSVKKITSYIETGLELYEAIQKIDIQQKQALIAELEKLRWKDFEAI